MQAHVVIMSKGQGDVAEKQDKKSVDSVDSRSFGQVPKTAILGLHRLLDKTREPTDRVIAKSARGVQGGLMWRVGTRLRDLDGIFQDDFRQDDSQTEILSQKHVVQRGSFLDVTQSRSSR